MPPMRSLSFLTALTLTLCISCSKQALETPELPFWSKAEVDRVFVLNELGEAESTPFGPTYGGKYVRLGDVTTQWASDKMVNLFRLDTDAMNMLPYEVTAAVLRATPEEARAFLAENRLSMSEYRSFLFKDHRGVHYLNAVGLVKMTQVAAQRTGEYTLAKIVFKNAAKIAEESKNSELLEVLSGFGGAK
jgi:hypothetical protein